MGPVALSDDAREVMREDLSERASWLDLEVTESKAETRDVSQKETNTITLSEDDYKRLQEAETKAEASETKVVALTEEVTTLNDQVKTLTDELEGERFLSDFTQAQREGRVDAKKETKEKWEKRYKDLVRETAREILFELPADAIPVSAKGSSEGGTQLSEVSVPEGSAHANRYVLDERAKQLMAEDKDLKYTDAVRKAQAEVEA